MHPTPPSVPLHAVAFALLAAGAAGCASGGSSTSGSAPIPSANGMIQNTVRVDGGTTQGSYQTQVTREDYASTVDLAASADRAFAVLPLVYEEVGLKVNTAESASRTLGVNGARVRRVHDETMSRFLSCGRDVTGTELADSYAVTLTVMSRVTPSGPTGSVLATQVIGTARPMGVSGSVLNCQSTGRLEERIGKLAQLRSPGAG